MKNTLRWIIKHWKPEPAFLLGASAALFFIGFSHLSFNVTGTNEFCGRCHEMRRQVVSWQLSSHVINHKGVVANCVDCHLPPTGFRH